MSSPTKAGQMYNTMQKGREQGKGLGEYSVKNTENNLILNTNENEYLDDIQDQLVDLNEPQDQSKAILHILDGQRQQIPGTS